MLLVSDDGNVALWPDFANPAASEPLASRLPGHVVALAAGSGEGGVLAAAGMADGSVHVLLSGGVPGAWAALIWPRWGRGVAQLLHLGTASCLFLCCSSSCLNLGFTQPACRRGTGLGAAAAGEAK